MSNDDTTPPPQSPPARARRSSFAGQTFADLFGSARGSMSRPSQDTGSSSPPNNGGMGPITTAAAQAQQRRRMSLTTLGLGGSPTQTSPFNSFRGRRESFSSANSGSIDESAIEDDPGPKDATTPATPFARRMSFGAQALRDVRNSKSSGVSGTGGGGGGGVGGQNGRSPPTAIAEENTNQVGDAQQQKTMNGTISARSDKGRGLSALPPSHHPLHSRSISLSTSSSPSSNNHRLRARSLRISRTGAELTGSASAAEGFNWSENLRTRAERTSIAGPPPGGLPFGNQAASGGRSQSVATMEPVKTMPKEQKRPDHFQERILKGDFYMD